jgi:hypothetical protein
MQSRVAQRFDTSGITASSLNKVCTQRSVAGLLSTNIGSAHAVWNKKIGENRFVSMKTVSNHTMKIFSKIAGGIPHPGDYPGARCRLGTGARLAFGLFFLKLERNVNYE